MAKKIHLTQGKVAIVDDEDFEYLNQWKWHVSSTKSRSNTFYARGYVSRTNGNKGSIFMHRLIMNMKVNEMQIDHINNNGLDNRKCNLRICTNTQNQHNRPIFTSNTSGYKGVFMHKLANKWAARIGVNKKMIYLGVFSEIRDAAKAYNEAAIKFHGEFAKLNEI